VNRQEIVAEVYLNLGREHLIFHLTTIQEVISYLLTVMLIEKERMVWEISDGWNL